MYHASGTDYYPDQQMHNIYINNILCIVSTPTVAVHHHHHLQGVLTLYFAKVTELLKLPLSKIS